MSSLRVTQGMQYMSALGYLQKNFGRLFENQMGLGTGRRVRVASDDPHGMARILDYARRAADLGAMRSNIAAGQRSLDASAADLQAITDVFSQARERAMQGLNGTLSAQDRATVADQLDQYVVTILGYLNAQEAGSFRFAGSRSEVAPFVRETGPDGIERVRYVGDDHVNRVQVAPGITEGVNVPGGRLLDVGPRRATQYFGATGLRQGAGTDTGVGRARITLAHIATGFGPLPGSITHAASGLATGASSAAKDTVLGLSHAVDLSVNGAGTGGTVSLNGGTPITFTTADSDLAVTGPTGEVVHLDLSSVTAGFTGQVPLISIGSISLGDGSPPQGINFSETSHRLTAADGSVTWVDLTGVTQAGNADVVYDGTLDAVNSLLAIRDLLRSGETAGSIRGALDEARELLAHFDRGTESVLRALTETGSASERLFGLDGRMAEIEVSVAARRSEVEDADLPALIAEMQENEATYQSSLLVTARLSRLSLLNYLG